MLSSYSLVLPNKVFSGEEALSQLCGILASEKSKKVAVFTDSGIKKAGVLELVLNYLDKAEVMYEIFDDIVPEPTYMQVQQIVFNCESYGADFIIAIGGGSVMDTAKLASVLSGSSYTVKDLLRNPLSASKKIKTLMIPTTAGTGAEATPNAIVAVPEEQLKVGIVNPDMVSDYVILDYRMVENLPLPIAASTGIDALCHAIECFTSNKANPFSDLFALNSLSLILKNIEKASLDREAKKEKENMLIASFYAGIAITSSGTTAVHALSYPLGGRYHIAHGISNAILLMPVMRFNEDVCSPRLADAYDFCFGTASGKDEKWKSSYMLSRMGEIVRNLNIPTSLSGFGVTLDDLDDLVDAGMKVTRLLNNNMKKVSKEDARKIYMEVL